jgi:hypothetical protein
MRNTVRIPAVKAQGGGTYTSRPGLIVPMLARRCDEPRKCKGPAAFDCEHSDILYVYQDAQTQPLKAIYFDNEGHVIRYDVSTPDSTRAIFASTSGPQIRLIYELKDAPISGKFQMRMPGQVEWKSCLEWTGAKR